MNPIPIDKPSRVVFMYANPREGGWERAHGGWGGQVNRPVSECLARRRGKGGT